MTDDENKIEANRSYRTYVRNYNGAKPKDAGFFYCPYIPLQHVGSYYASTEQTKSNNSVDIV